MLRARRSGPGVIAWWRPPPAPSPRPCSPVSRRSPPSASPSTTARPDRRHLRRRRGFDLAQPPRSKKWLSADRARGNVGEEKRVRATLDRAIDVLCDGADIQLLAASSDYRTPPVGRHRPAGRSSIAQSFVTTELIPPALLERAQAVERHLGPRPRARARWGPAHAGHRSDRL